MEYPNTGAVFRAKEKKHDKSPDMFGSLKIDKHYLLNLIEESNGQLVEIKFSGWTAVSQKGEKYLSLKLSTLQPTPKKDTEDDDSIPF